MLGMNEAAGWLLIVQSVVISCCLVLTACRIFKSDITDWYPFTIWGIAVAVLLVEFIGLTYSYCTHKRGNYKDSIGLSFNTAYGIMTAVLFWEFSWGLFI